MVSLLPSNTHLCVWAETIQDGLQVVANERGWHYFLIRRSIQCEANASDLPASHITKSSDADELLAILVKGEETVQPHLSQRRRSKFLLELMDVLLPQLLQR